MVDLETLKILIVEDDDMSFLYLNQIFKIVKGKITRAKNASEALALCDENNGFNLILMDLQLPDMSGYDLTALLKQKCPDITIMAQTAARSPQEKEKALEAGCSCVLVKPFSMEELIDKINHCIR